jgi:NADH-quinone oxidoreductase subunit I
MSIPWLMAEAYRNRACYTRAAHMPIQDDQIIDVSPKRLSTTESLFVMNVFKGIGTTMRHCFENLGRNGANKNTIWVVQYPEQKRDDRPVEEGGQFREYFRGVHRLNRDEDGRVRCVACFMCATACPANCIHIVAEESPWDDREKYPKQFDIDELRCIYCGMCEEACPCDAIELTPHYEITALSRAEMIFDKQKLLEVFDNTIEDKPM